MTVLAFALLFGTPVMIVVFLMCFLVRMAQGRFDNGFTRFCDAALVPSGVAVIVMIAATLRWF